MNINDFFIPIFVIVAIIAIFIFLKNKSKNIESNKAEGFIGNDNSLEKHDFSKYQINIGENLFVGFGSKTESDNQIDILQQAKMDFSEKMKNIYPNKNSIVIDNDNDNVLGNICLGSPKYTGDKLTEKLEEHKSCDEDGNCNYYNSNFLKDNYDRCLNYDTLESFDLTKNEIPYFEDWRGRQVYYNGDQPMIRHNKLCIRDVDNNENICLVAKDIKSLNGKNSVKLKMRDDNNSEQFLLPYNLEYGYHKGFGGVVSTPHYMLDNQFSTVDRNLRNSGANRGCYSFGYHYGTGAGYYSDNYYLIAHPRPLSYYTHIHEHEDAE